ncbi:MAG: hypothetical protein RXR31_03055 [Thermoproteota archaeon]
MQPVLQKLCPNDSKDIIAERLERGLACEICLPKDYEDKIKDKDELIQFLQENGKLEGDFLE